MMPFSMLVNVGLGSTETTSGNDIIDENGRFWSYLNGEWVEGPALEAIPVEPSGPDVEFHFGPEWEDWLQEHGREFTDPQGQRGFDFRGGDEPFVEDAYSGQVPQTQVSSAIQIPEQPSSQMPPGIVEQQLPPTVAVPPMETLPIAPEFPAPEPIPTAPSAGTVVSLAGQSQLRRTGSSRVQRLLWESALRSNPDLRLANRIMDEFFEKLILVPEGEDLWTREDEKKTEEIIAKWVKGEKVPTEAQREKPFERWDPEHNFKVQFVINFALFVAYRQQRGGTLAQITQDARVIVTNMRNDIRTTVSFGELSSESIILRDAQRYLWGRSGPNHFRKELGIPELWSYTGAPFAEGFWEDIVKTLAPVRGRTNPNKRHSARGGHKWFRLGLEDFLRHDYARLNNPGVRPDLLEIRNSPVNEIFVL